MWKFFLGVPLKHSKLMVVGFIKFKPYLSSQSIAHSLSCLHTSAQNGTTERKHRHVVDTGLTLWPSQIFHSIIGLMLSKRLYFSSIECPPQSSIIFLPTRNYFIKHLTTFPYEFLVVLATLICVHIKLISLVFSPVNVSS